MTDARCNFDTIILGGGAAGLMCAVEAGNRGRRVLLVEHNEAAGKKIRISGGGRCNFTNLNTAPGRFISENPRFCYSALSRYTPRDFIARVDRHNIAWHEKKLGQLFCDGSAQQIIDALVNDCLEAGVVMLLDCRVARVEKPGAFRVETSRGVFDAPSLVVATGGLSIPKLGATDLGYRIAAQFAVPIVTPAPALVPLTLDAEQLRGFKDLSGNSFDAAVSIGNISFEDSVLITHRGLSGPAILQISSFWSSGQSVHINLFPGLRLEEELLRMKKTAPKTRPEVFLHTRLTIRFARLLCERHGWNRPLCELSDKSLRAMARALQDWQLPARGTEGYAKAEVTRGGVDTRALSPKTMEVRDVPGLYFIGEVMDVTGWLGGYNFQWAWASAAAAGRAL